MIKYYTQTQWWNSVPDLNVRKNLLSNSKKTLIECHWDFKDILSNSFDWSSTEEGTDYWILVYYRYQHLKIKL